MSPASRTFAVISGGGTAGHVLPALAIAEELEDAGHGCDELHYVGAQRGIEAQLLPATPYAHTLLDVDGVQRGFSRRDLSRNLRFVPRQLRARRQARALLRELRPAVVVSVGGYASLPAVLAARRLRIPVVVVSYDRRPGRSSELTARFADAVAAAYPGSPLRRAEVTGAPVRRSIRAVDRLEGRAAARAALGIGADRFVVVCLGGSQGSGVLNTAIADYVAAHRHDARLAVYHLAGARFADQVRAAAADAIGPDPAVDYRVVGYEERMPLLYAAADVIVGRGGASTVAEVAITGAPAILVPWSGAADDHQRLNVEFLSDQGAAILLPEDRVADLAALLDRLRAAPHELSALGARAWEAGTVHRDGRLATLIERTARHS